MPGCASKRDVLELAMILFVSFQLSGQNGPILAVLKISAILQKYSTFVAGFFLMLTC